MRVLTLQLCPNCGKRHVAMNGVMVCNRNAVHLSSFVVLDGLLYRLTNYETRVFNGLLWRFGITVSRGELIEHVWPDPDTEAGNAHKLIDEYVHRIRKKLRGSRLMVHNQHGLGHSLQETKTAAEGITPSAAVAPA